MWKTYGRALLAIMLVAGPAQAQDEPAVPDSVMAEIKAQAAEDWPDDFTTQRYWIEQQVEAFVWRESYEPGGVPAKVLDRLFEKATEDWPADYTTQKYWIEQQVEDYLALQ